MYEEAPINPNNFIGHISSLYHPDDSFRDFLWKSKSSNRYLCIKLAQFSPQRSPKGNVTYFSQALHYFQEALLYLELERAQLR